MDKKHLQRIRDLVGPVTETQIQYVECAAGQIVGVFIPSVGQCGYAITPQHTHPAYSALIAFEEDSPVFPKGLKIKGDQYGCTLMSPDIPHEEEVCENFTRFVVIMIDKTTFERAWSNYTKQQCGPFFWKPFALQQSVLAQVKQFIAEFDSNHPGKDEMLDAIGIYLCHTIIRSVLNIQVTTDTVSEHLDIQRAVEYMHAHFGEKISIADLARKVNCSESHFSRVFKRDTSYSPGDYLIKIRIDKSKKLLSNSNMNATQIAYECGFNSASHFSDTFKKNIGMSPLQFRKSFS